VRVTMSSASEEPSSPGHRRNVNRFGRFLTVGALATSLHYLILVWLVLAFQFSATVASCIGFILSACLNYCLNYSITFESSRSHVQAIPAFSAVACVGLLLNAAIMMLLTGHTGIHYLAAQAVATVATLLWSFTANRNWTFRNI
jgi:putative flippase GtrA